MLSILEGAWKKIQVKRVNKSKFQSSNIEKGKLSVKKLKLLLFYIYDRF